MKRGRISRMEKRKCYLRRIWSKMTLNRAVSCTWADMKIQICWWLQALKVEPAQQNRRETLNCSSAPLPLYQNNIRRKTHKSNTQKSNALKVRVAAMMGWRMSNIARMMRLNSTRRTITWPWKRDIVSLISTRSPTLMHSSTLRLHRPPSNTNSEMSSSSSSISLRLLLRIHRSDQL